MPIRRRFGRFQLLFRPGINRWKCLPSSSAVVFAAFVDIFSFEINSAHRKSFFSPFGVQEFFQKQELFLAKSKKKVEDKSQGELFYVLLFVFLTAFYCAQTAAPDKWD